MRNSIVAFFVVVTMSFVAQAEFYWLAVGIKGDAGKDTDRGFGNYLVLTNDDPSVSYKPVKLYDVRRTENNGTRLKKYNGYSATSPYEGCGNGEAEYDLTLPIRENGVACTLVNIGDEAFRENNYIGSIRLPETLEEIGTRAFLKCYYLKNVEWPDDTSKLTVGNQLFDACNSLSGHIEWPTSAESVGDNSFYGCYKMEGFFGLSVTNVGQNAFRNCFALKVLEFGDGESITFGTEVFRDSKALRTVLFHNATPYINANITGENGNSVLDWWSEAGATAYVPFNDAKDGPTDSWATFKTNFEAAYSGNEVTWPTDNGDGTWTDGSIYIAQVKKTLKLRFWDPDDTSSTALLAH